MLRLSSYKDSLKLSMPIICFSPANFAISYLSLYILIPPNILSIIGNENLFYKSSCLLFIFTNACNEFLSTLAIEESIKSTTVLVVRMTFIFS